MQLNHRYPKIFVRSKNDIIKRIANTTLPRDSALKLINDVIANHDHYWIDSRHSEPEKNKFVRDAKGSPLGYLLKLIDQKLLAPYDKLLPEFVFGGISRRNHIDAAKYLLGTQKQRSLLALDITTFFEQITEDRVYKFFLHKARCGKKAARLLARICCVAEGPKGYGSGKKVLARGFATSTRLAAWCNLDTFLRLDWLVKKKLKGHDSRIATFVDDIGITASRIEKAVMETLSLEAQELLKSFDRNQSLPINLTKTKIYSYEEGIRHLGLILGRNKLSLGSKTQSKKAKVDRLLKITKNPLERKILRVKKRAYFAYREQIRQANKIPTAV